LSEFSIFEVGYESPGENICSWDERGVGLLSSLMAAIIIGLALRF